MSQFATMLPLQGGANQLKTGASTAATGSQEALSGDGEGFDFAQTLQELTEINPNAAALLLALQQTGGETPLPFNLANGGSSLPLLNSSGNLLPQSQHQLQSLQFSQLPQQQELPLPDLRQLQQQVGERALLERGQVFTDMIRSGLAAEGIQTLEVRGTGDSVNQLQGLGLNLQTLNSSAAQRPMTTLSLQVPVAQPGWDKAVGDSIQWMVSRNVQQAEIRLTPPELGPMEIKISLQNDQTHVQFVANHGATRDALESAIPRLRELFGEINLNLANVDVSQQGAGGRGAGEDSQASGSEVEGGPAAEAYNPASEGGSSLARIESQGILDTYA